MLPFGVTIPATVPQRSEIPEGLMHYPVLKSIAVSMDFHKREKLSVSLFQTILSREYLDQPNTAEYASALYHSPY
jgi:hypothetical protein